MARTLTKTAFESWLNWKGSNTVVGVTRSCSDCPLAQFLQARTGKGVSVGQQTYNMSHKPKDLPRWAKRFVMRIDYGVSQYEGVNVTAQQALSALSQVKS